MSKHPTLNITVERTIAADPAELYDLVADVTRVGELSDECTSAEWVGKVAEPVVGARFKGTNTLGSSNWSTKPKVTAAERGRVFEFKVPMSFGPVWRYEFEEVDGGTRVIESVRQAKPSPWFIRRAQKKEGITDRSSHVAQSMRQTLANLDALVATPDSVGVGHSS